MTTTNALTAGVRLANKSLRVVALLYIANILLAAVLASGFHSILASTLGDSMSLERLVKDFDYTVYSDFMFKEEGRITALLSQMTWLLIFYATLNTLLGGGTIAWLLGERDSFSLRGFFEDCGYYFFRFLRLLFVFAVVGVLLGLLYVGIAGVLFGAVTDGAVSEVWPFTLGVVLLALFLFIVMLIVTVADYAKIATVAEDNKSMLKTAWRSARFVFRHFLSTTLLQLSVVLLVALAIALYLFLEVRIGMATPFTILLMFVVQQLSVGFKIYTRVLAFGGQLELFRTLQPVPEPIMPAVIPEPGPVPVAAPVEPVVETPVEQAPKRRPAAKKPAARKPRTTKKATTRKSR